MSQNPQYNPPQQSSGMSTMTIVAIVLGVMLLAALVIGAILAMMLLPAVSQVRGAARRVQAQNQVRQIVLAAHNYHSAFGKFPNDKKSEDGQALHSWRTELLPFLEQMNLADQIDKDIAWDEGTNVEYTSYEVATFISPRGGNESPGLTHFVAVVDVDTVMGKEKVTFDDIADGTPFTGLLIEFPESDIQWGQPKDVTLAQAIKIIQGSTHGGTVVGMADCSIIEVPPEASREEITKLFNCNDGPSSAWTPFAFLLFGQIEDRFLAVGKQAQKRFVVLETILQPGQDCIELAIVLFDSVESILDFGGV